MRSNINVLILLCVLSRAGGRAKVGQRCIKKPRFAETKSSYEELSGIDLQRTVLESGVVQFCYAFSTTGAGAGLDSGAGV